MDIEPEKLVEILFQESLSIFKEAFGQEVELQSDGYLSEVQDEAMDLFFDEILPLYCFCHSKEILTRKKKYTQDEVESILLSFSYFIEYHVLRMQQEKIMKRYLPKRLQEAQSSRPIISYTDYMLGYANLHFVFQDLEGNKFHLKCVMSDPFYNKHSKLNEVFVYKLLELLGYGPKVEAIFVNEMSNLYLLSEDLGNKKREKPNKEVSFLTATMKEIESAECESFQMHLVACNFLIDLLELADVYTNKRNFGIKTASRQVNIEEGKGEEEKEDDEYTEKIIKKLKIERIQESKEKLKIFILDFHLSLEERPLKVEQLQEKYFSKVGQNREQQNWLFQGIVHILQEKRMFERVIERLKKGNHNGKLSFENALQTAFNYTVEVSKKIEELSQTNQFGSSLREVFCLNIVEKQMKYYLDKWLNLQKLITIPFN